MYKTKRKGWVFLNKDFNEFTEENSDVVPFVNEENVTKDNSKKDPKGRSKAEILTLQAKEMFGTTKPTASQFAYLLDMQKPSNYILRNHTINGKPLTFEVKSGDRTQALNHRPWQVEVLNSEHPNTVVRKSRQLGFTELFMEKMLHFADTHSYDSVRALLTMTSKGQMDDNVKSRLNPQFQNGYYSTILDKYNDSLNAKKIRNSWLYFRSSHTPGGLEGLKVDMLSLK